MADAEKAAEGAQAETTEDLSLLDQIVAESGYAQEAPQQERARDVVTSVVTELLRKADTIPADLQNAVNSLIREIDSRVSLQLNEVMHAPELQKLEASWRGLRYLLDRSETSTMLKIKVLNVSKKELLKDLQTAPEFDQSALFKKVYEEEYGTFGGTPVGALMGDYEFGKSSQDIDLLEKVSQVAAAAHAPFLTAASSEMFGMDSYSQLAQPRDLAQIFDTVEYAKWQAFRNSEDSRYVALTAPRMMLREPWGGDNPLDAFGYEERVDGTNHSKYLWGNSAWALSSRVTEAFAKYGWCATIRGVESGGLVEGLPVHNFKTDSGDVAMKCPTEVSITDRREKEMAELGFAGLVHQKDTPNAAFFSVQSAQKAKVYDDDDATANARLSAQLPYIFATSRFAHYLKCMMRDKIGGFTSKGEIDKFLNRWISNYVVANDDAAPDVKAKRPLRAARIDVEEVPGNPGAFRAVAFLRPHFMLDEINISLRLVADLPAPAK